MQTVELQLLFFYGNDNTFRQTATELSSLTLLLSVLLGISVAVLLIK